MTDDFKLLCELFVSSLRGERYSKTLEKGEIARVVSLAAFHGCSYGILYALSMLDGNETAKRSIKRRVLSEQSKNASLTALFSLFEKKGIKACVIKGNAVGRFYALPECRDSADTDILIDKASEERVYEIMSEQGCQVVPRTPYSHHGTCTSSELGTVEIHVSLFFEMLNKVLFKNIDESVLIKEEPVQVCEDNFSYSTLGYTDHYIFLALHMIQHFIRSGTSIRQVCDILIYAEKCGDKIDFERFDSVISTLGYTGIMNTVYTVGEIYFGFDTQKLPPHKKVADAIALEFMNDMEQGGWIGKGREDGEELFRHYGMLKTENKTEYKKYLKRYQRKKIFGSLFPERKRIYAHFPFAKFPLLLPVGWVCWLFYGAKLYKSGELKSNVNERDALDDIQKQRLKLFFDMEL